jgi:hypothetical protein
MTVSCIAAVLVRDGATCLASLAPPQARLDDGPVQQIEASERQTEELQGSQAAESGAPAPAAAAQPAAPEPRATTPTQVGVATADKLPTSFYIPSADTLDHVYSFVKGKPPDDPDVQDGGGAPSAQGIPLYGSLADLQWGDLQFTARQFGTDFNTQPATEWRTSPTKIEFDTAGDQSNPSVAARSSGHGIHQWTKLSFGRAPLTRGAARAKTARHRREGNGT